MNIPDLTPQQREQVKQIIDLYHELNKTSAQHYTIQEWVCAGFGYLPKEAAE